MASSVPLVIVNSSGATSKKRASVSMALEYSGYIESASADMYSRRHSITFGEQPTVFSLKSKRSFPARPPVGGEYGAIFRTASRGASLLIPNLHRARVRFQSFRARQRRDRGRKRGESLRRQFLHRNHFDEIRGRQSPADSRNARGRQHVIRTTGIIARCFGTMRAKEDTASV